MSNDNFKITETDKCPVDHAEFQQNSKPKTSSQSWLSSLFWANPNAASSEVKNCPVDHTKFKTSNNNNNDLEEKCPVDPEARERWLKNMKQGQNNNMLPGDHPSISSYDIEVTKDDSKSCSSTELPKEVKYQTDVPLPVDREISSIPRAGEEKGNWIYPSQKQFFEAMQRKNWNPDASDMKTVVPIHNAVNERVWTMIKIWEAGQGGESCGGIQLTSFKGESKKLTPRARWRLLTGYERPFDRHDWVVDRCGKKIDYVIDFYSGKPDPKGNPSFFLDVRPKLNSLEGWRLRIYRALGF